MQRTCLRFRVEWCKDAGNRDHRCDHGKRWGAGRPLLVPSQTDDAGDLPRRSPGQTVGMPLEDRAASVGCRQMRRPGCRARRHPNVVPSLEYGDQAHFFGKDASKPDDRVVPGRANTWLRPSVPPRVTGHASSPRLGQSVGERWVGRAHFIRLPSPPPAPRADQPSMRAVQRIAQCAERGRTIATIQCPSYLRKCASAARNRSVIGCQRHGCTRSVPDRSSMWSISTSRKSR